MQGLDIYFQINTVKENFGDKCKSSGRACVQFNMKTRLLQASIFPSKLKTWCTTHSQ